MAEGTIKINVKSEEVKKGSARLDGLTRSSVKADKATDKLEKEVKSLEKTTKRGTKANNENSKSLGSMALKAGLVVGALSLLSKGIKSSVSAAADMETLETSFISLTGSVQGAKDVMEELTSFTASTPFQLEGVANASRQLIAAKGTTEGLTKTLTVLGDIAATSAVPLGDLASIYTKAFNKGKVQTEELNQISERGIPIIADLAKQFGVTKDKIFEMASQGKISFEDLEIALIAMSSEGGSAFNAMALQSETMNGKVSTLSDSFGLLQAAIGKAVGEGVGLKTITSNLTDLINEFNAWIATRDNELNNQNKRKAATQSMVGLLENEQRIIEAIALTKKAISESTGEELAAHREFQKLNQADLAANFEKLKAFESQALHLKRQQNNLIAVSQEIRDNKDQYDLLAFNVLLVSEEERERLKSLKEQQAVLQGQVSSYASIVELSNQVLSSIPSYLGGTRLPSPDALPAADPVSVSVPKIPKSRVSSGGGGGYSSNIQAEEEKAVELRLDIRHRGWELEKARLNQEFDERHQLILEAEDITEQERTNLVLSEARSRAQALIGIEKEKQNEQLNFTSDFLGNLAGLSEAFGKKGAKIAKKAAIAKGAVDSITAYNVAFVDAPAGTPLTLRFASALAAAAAVAENTAKIASAGNYAQGGIIPGQSYSGDNLQANVNSGEMVLNRQQQANLFNQANGRGGGGGNVTIINKTSSPVTATTRTDSSGNQEIIIREAVKRTKAELTSEAAQGGGSVFPALLNATGQRRRGTA